MDSEKSGKPSVGRAKPGGKAGMRYKEIVLDFISWIFIFLFIGILYKFTAFYNEKYGMSAWDQWRLGYKYYDSQNYEEAMKVWRFSAERGFTLSQFVLGVKYYEGKIVAQDYKEAVKWCRLAAEQSDGLFQLAVPAGVKDSGHPVAQFMLGSCYLEGKGVPKDEKEAAKWYRLAAEPEFLSSWCDVIAKEQKLLIKAAELFRQAAEQGDAGSQYMLGCCYIPQDCKEAVKWFRLAAEQDYAMAQGALGYCYKNGKGVDKNPEEAVKWYRLAADQGNAGAQYRLGCCYEDGKGVDKNLKEAVEWLRKSAEQGHIGALHDLERSDFADAKFAAGVCYADGKGVDKNLELAAEFFREAAEQGHEGAKKRLNKMR